MTARRLFFSVIFLCAFGAASADIGIGGGVMYAFAPNPFAAVSVSARSDTSPWCFFASIHSEKNEFSVYADNWFVNERIAEHIDFFVLWGISVGGRLDDELAELSTGARFGAGLDFFFLRRHAELFVQSAWNPYFGVRSDDGDFEPIVSLLSFPCSTGLRLWF